MTADRRDALPLGLYIFEDHWMCREALVSVLGARPELRILGVAEHVTEGIEDCLRLKPDVVLMDILFHGQRLGIEATATLRKKLPDTKVIIFTEFPDEHTLQSAVEAGSSGFLLKQEVQDPEIILEALRAVHRGDAYMTPSMTAKVLKVVQHLVQEDKHRLTKRELQILTLISEGKDNKDISQELTIDIRTVANHVSNILFKLEAKNRTRAVAIARRDGLVK